MPRCVRCSARTSSRRDRWWRPIACASTSCTSTRSTPDELRRIEQIVNEAILRNEPVTTTVRNTQEAIAAGAMALFGEKYGDRVRVVAIGDGAFSTELCGGTHVRATGEIGPLLITEESGVAAGVRRVEALTGLGALAFARPRIEDLRTRAQLPERRSRRCGSRGSSRASSRWKRRSRIATGSWPGRRPDSPAPRASRWSSVT